MGQRMRGRMEMNRDKASKQTEADEHIMMDDRQQDRKENICPVPACLCEG